MGNNLNHPQNRSRRFLHRTGTDFSQAEGTNRRSLVGLGPYNAADKFYPNFPSHV
jgi:hypothetical protein